MNFPRSILLSTALIAGFAIPAQAGFEFSGGTASSPAPVTPPSIEAAMAQPDDYAPMPIAPPAAVQAEVLPPMPPQQDMATPPVISCAPAPIQRPAPIAYVQPAPVRAAPQRTSSADGLVINPYPLQAGVATHAHASQAIPVEQAMLEETGRLKAVATPGDNSGAGMIARADVARYGADTPAPRPAMNDLSYDASALTPMPGGEGPTLQAMQGNYPAPMIEARPLIPVPAIPADYPVPRAPSTGALSNGNFPEAVGFGRELPLALALSQVVPPEYSFSFGNSVDAGETVSWEGGKSWDAVLQDMLQPLGMRAVISGKQVVVQRAA